MAFLITAVIDDGTEKDAILNLDLCFAFARDANGHAIAMSANGSKIVTTMPFNQLRDMCLELNAMEFEGPPDDAGNGPGISVQLK